MNARFSIFLTTALDWTWPGAAHAASPTPVLKTGSYAGQRATVVGGQRPLTAGVFTLSRTLGTQQIGEGGGAFVGKKN